MWYTNSIRKKCHWLQGLWIRPTWINSVKHVKYMINLQNVLKSFSSTKHVSTCSNFSIWLAVWSICRRKTKALPLLANVICLVLSPQLHPLFFVQNAKMSVFTFCLHGASEAVTIYNSRGSELLIHFHQSYSFLIWFLICFCY